MAGAPSLGKMSTFISRMAMIDVNTTARTATTIVTGRRMAVNTNHMKSLPRHRALGPSSRLSQFFQKRRQVAMRLRRREQGAPQPEPRHRVIGFRLREQPLRLGHFRDAGES